MTGTQEKYEDGWKIIEFAPKSYYHRDSEVALTPQLASTHGHKQANNCRDLQQLGGVYYCLTNYCPPMGPAHFKFMSKSYFLT